MGYSKSLDPACLISSGGASHTVVVQSANMVHNASTSGDIPSGSASSNAEMNASNSSLEGEYMHRPSGRA